MTTDPENCVPGQQIECACPGGSPGAQACLADGSGYDVCECPGDEADSSGSSPDTTGSADTSSSSGVNPDGCEVCGGDALAGGCAMQLEQCLADDGCATMALCVQQCGLSADCVAMCVDAMVDDVSTSLFNEVLNCVFELCPECSGP